MSTMVSSTSKDENPNTQDEEEKEQQHHSSDPCNDGGINGMGKGEEQKLAQSSNSQHNTPAQSGDTHQKQPGEFGVQADTMGTATISESKPASDSAAERNSQLQTPYQSTENSDQVDYYIEEDDSSQKSANTRKRSCSDDLINKNEATGSDSTYKRQRKSEKDECQNEADKTCPAQIQNNGHSVGGDVNSSDFINNGQKMKSYEDYIKKEIKMHLDVAWSTHQELLQIATTSGSICNGNPPREAGNQGYDIHRSGTNRNHENKKVSLISENYTIALGNVDSSEEVNDKSLELPIQDATHTIDDSKQKIEAEGTLGKPVDSKENSIVKSQANNRDQKQHQPTGDREDDVENKKIPGNEAGVQTTGRGTS